ncbi:hypothetical protein JG687_00013962 [Phytophthora cactorum]|uniref:Secreted protein n=1 Tax=Phytophthora cactorum TaxID=29920 RepID=A0A8T1U2V7_9STRA|nr:hypothetical protein JG687_00013962 [Phytophthora cactorum]
MPRLLKMSLWFSTWVIYCTGKRIKNETEGTPAVRTASSSGGRWEGKHAAAFPQSRTFRREKRLRSAMEMDSCSPR